MRRAEIEKRLNYQESNKADHVLGFVNMGVMAALAGLVLAARLNGGDTVKRVLRWN